MSTTELIELIETLPGDKKKQVEMLVFELIQNAANQKLNIDSEPLLIKKVPMMFEDLEGFVSYKTNDFNESFALNELKDSKRNFGGGKDIFGEIADDFNEPLDELKNYL